MTQWGFLATMSHASVWTHLYQRYSFGFFGHGKNPATSIHGRVQELPYSFP